MTAQIPEELVFQGQRMSMFTTPLAPYLADHGRDPGFNAPMTALWRGYVGTWEIADDRLYLIQLRGTLESGEKASLRTIFPDCTCRVFAEWYSGTIRVPQGELIEYVHAGYASVYERELLLEVDHGVVLSVHIQENGEAKPVFLDRT